MAYTSFSFGITLSENFPKPVVIPYTTAKCQVDHVAQVTLSIHLFLHTLYHPQQHVISILHPLQLLIAVEEAKKFQKGMEQWWGGVKGERE